MTYTCIVTYAYTEIHMYMNVCKNTPFPLTRRPRSKGKVPTMLRACLKQKRKPHRRLRTVPSTKTRPKSKAKQIQSPDQARLNQTRPRPQPSQTKLDETKPNQTKAETKPDQSPNTKPNQTKAKTKDQSVVPCLAQAMILLLHKSEAVSDRTRGGSEL